MRWRTGPSVSSSLKCLLFHDMPDVVAVVARDIARLLVVLPVIERLALMGPLLGAVVAIDDSIVTDGLGLRRREERRPIGGALPIAARLAGCRIAVPSVERHAFLCIDQHLAQLGVGDLGWRRLGQRH